MKGEADAGETTLSFKYEFTCDIFPTTVVTADAFLLLRGIGQYTEYVFYVNRAICANSFINYHMLPCFISFYYVHNAQIWSFYFESSGKDLL